MPHRVATGCDVQCLATARVRDRIRQESADGQSPLPRCGSNNLTVSDAAPQQLVLVAQRFSITARRLIKLTNFWWIILSGYPNGCWAPGSKKYIWEERALLHSLTRMSKEPDTDALSYLRSRL
jgi:hypothetical protein